jgi:hypothetical protein
MRKFLLGYTMLAALGAPAMADPFVFGSEPGWGKNMSSRQHRAAGFDDVRTALKYNRKSDAPTTKGVPGYAFNVTTIRHGIHGHGGNSGGGGGASGNSGGVNINIGGSGGGAQNSAIPPKAPPFMISQIKSEPFGVFATLQECDAARAVKIAELDAGGLRFPHQRSDAPVTTTHFSDGSSTTGQTHLQERLDVTFCEKGVYTPGPSFNIAKDIQTTGAAAPSAQTTTLEVPPGFVKHWVAPRAFTRAIPGTSEVIEILSARGRELVFMVKPDTGTTISTAANGTTSSGTTSTTSLGTTNILLVDDNGEVVANLQIVIPGMFDREVRQGPDGSLPQR